MRSAVTREAKEVEARRDRPGRVLDCDVQNSVAVEDTPLRLQGDGRLEGDDQSSLRRSVTSMMASWTMEGGELRAVLAWTLVAFLLRFLLLWRFEHVISPDGVEYLMLGRKLVEGNFQDGLSPYWPPLYPLLVGFSSLLFRDAEFAGRLVSVVAGGLLVLPAHSLTRAWYGRRVALIFACIFALHPLLIYYSTVLLTEATYTLLFTCGVLAGWSALKGGRARAHLLAGAAFGACYLLKPESACFLLLLLVPALGVKLFDRRRSFKRAVRNALLLLAGFMVLSLPYLVYIRRETGAWTISAKLVGHLWQGSREVTASAPPATFVPDAATAVVQITKALRHEYEVFNLIFPLGFIVFAGLGLFRREWTRERAWRELYLLSFVAAPLAGYALTLPNIRFIVPLLPILICWLANGVVEFESWDVGTLEKFWRAQRFLSRARELVIPLIIAGLLFSLLPLFVYLLRGDKWGDYYGQKRAAVWIRERAGARSPVIMSTVRVAAFYTGGRHVALADEEIPLLVERARREGVEYVIINERNVKHMGLRRLLDEQSEHAGLRLAHSLTEAPGHRILIYELVGAAGGSRRQEEAP